MAKSFLEDSEELANMILGVAIHVVQATKKAAAKILPDDLQDTASILVASYFILRLATAGIAKEIESCPEGRQLLEKGSELIAQAQDRSASN
jgi:hypothetical protein